MKRNRNLVLAFLLAITATMSSCEVIGDIFKAGVWVGVLLVVVVLAIIFWIISKAKK